MFFDGQKMSKNCVVYPLFAVDDLSFLGGVFKYIYIYVLCSPRTLGKMNPF